MSYRTLTTKPLNASLKTLLKRGGHIGLGLSAFTPVLALANPTGGHVVSGQATIANPSANGTIITQRSNSAIINWQQFNIGAGQFVQFLQPSSSSVVLNRVIGNSSSSILGSLTANGQVFLVNTNGVYFGKGSSIDTQGFLASTLGITDQNFLAHNYVFNQPGAANATVINDGSITSHHGGYVVLAGDYAENDGLISAQSGHVVLASGSKATLALNGNNLVNFAVNQSTLAKYAGVKNTGSILADGGTVIMTADVANLLKSTVVNNTGLVEAHAISKDGGVIQLLASGGNISNAGTLDVSATGKDQAGGDVTLKGDEKTFLANTSNIDATGNGANGGSVEVSGKAIAMRGAMNIGRGGKLLMDPGSMTIVNTSSNSNHNNQGSVGNTSSAGTIGVNFIENQLNKGVNVAIKATHLIDASANVHAISATKTVSQGGGGNLSFEVSQVGGDLGGHILLSGVDITIGGKLTASMGYGIFGHLMAGSIDLNATGDVELLNATASINGKFTAFSAKTTAGSLIIDAAHIRSHSGGGEAGLALDAKSGLTLDASIGSSGGSHFGNDVTLMGASVTDTKDIITSQKVIAIASAGNMHLGVISASDGASLTATGGNIQARDILTPHGAIAITDKKGSLTLGSSGGPGSFLAGESFTINAAHILHGGGGTVKLSAGGGKDLVVDGVFGISSAAGLDGDLILEGSVIDVNNNIKASSILVDGDQLAYTGKNKTFSISATDGGVNMEAAIGSAAAPVTYNVAIFDKDGLVRLQRSIFVGSTAGKLVGNITVSETGLDGGNVAGVLAGSDISGGTNPTTLSAKGNITLTGVNVGLGHVIPSSAGVFSELTLKAGKNITITAQGSGSHSGQLGIVAEAANGANRSILVQAGRNLTLTGHDVDVRGGAATVHMGAQGTASADASVTLKAGGNLTLQSSGGNGRIDLLAGMASAQALGSSGFIRGAHADAGVTLIAGKAISLTAKQINLNAGPGFAQASAGEGASNSATASADVSLTAGTTVALTATGGSIEIHAAGATSPGASNGSADAHGARTIATTKVHGDVELTAGDAGAITLSAGQVTVDAGSSVGVFGSHTRHNANAAGASSGVAAFTDTGNVDINAGAGGISILASTGDVQIAGGQDAGRGAVVKGQLGGSASMDVEAHVDFTTSGSMQITGQHVHITAGKDGASHATVSGSHGSATLSVDQGVDITAKGALTITATDDVRLDASGGQGDAARVQADFGQATLSAAGGVSLQAGSVTITASSLVQFDAGYGAGRGASVHAAGSSVQAALTTQGNIAITATTGNISVKGLQGVQMFGGSHLDAGFGLFHSSTTTFAASAPGGSSLRTTSKHFTVDHTQVFASGSGTKAVLTGGAAVNLTAKGAITLSQTDALTGSIELETGNGAAADLHAQAGGAGSADVHTQTGISLQAGKISMTGRSMNLSAQGGALVGGRSITSRSSQDLQSGVPIGPVLKHVLSSTSEADSATGQGSKLNIGVDASLNIKAGSVTVSAFGSNLQMSGAGDMGARAKISAQDGAVADVNLDDQLNIVATGAVSVNAAHKLGLHGGFESGDLVLQANSASANLVTTTGVAITAATVKLTAGSSVALSANGAIGSHGSMTATHGIAKSTMVAGISLTARNAIGVSLTGSSNEGQIRILGGKNDGMMEHVTANSGGSALLNISDDVDLKVTATAGTLTVSTGKHKDGFISAKGGAGVGHGASSSSKNVVADHGTAVIDVTANVDLSALGSISLVGGKDHSGGVFFSGPSASLAANARAHASSSGKAIFTVSANSNITGGNIALSGNEVMLEGGGSEGGNGVHVAAYGGGIASVDAMAVTTLKATGTLAVTAVEDLSVLGAVRDNGESASVFAAGGKAKASYDLDESVNLSAVSGITLKAGGDIGIGGASRSAEGSGAEGKIQAGAQGKATYHQTASVTITTGGTFTAAAAGELSMGGAPKMGGFGNLVSANGGGATAAYVADGTLKVSAKTIKLSASSMSLHGGLRAAGANGPGSAAHVQAKNGGSADLSVDESLDLTAVTAFSANLTGKGNSDDLYIFGGGHDAGFASASASGALSKAALTTTTAANVLVTGAGGTLTLSGGKQTAVYMYVGGSDGTASGMAAKAVKHGTATATTTGGAILSAKGAVSLSELSGELSIVGGYSDDAQGMVATALVGGKATTTADMDVSITGGSVTLTTGGTLIVDGAYKNVGDGDMALAQTGGTAKVMVDAQATLTALTGALNLKAGSLDMSAGGLAAGNSDIVTGSGGKAGMVLDAHVLLNGATGVSLVTTGIMELDLGGVAHGSQAHLVATIGGQADLIEDMGLSIVTGGAFKASAGSDLFAHGEASLGRDVHLQASDGGIANAAFTGGFGVTAKNITFTSAKALFIQGGSAAVLSAQVAAHSGSAAVSADVSVNLVATGGAISVRGVDQVRIVGGQLAAAGGGATSHGFSPSHSFNLHGSSFSRSESSHRVVHTATVSADGGVASLTGNAGVNLTATGAISVTQTGSGNVLSIGGGRDAAQKTDVLAQNRGTATVDGEADVDIKTGGVLTLKGVEVKLFGGDSAALGAPSSFQRTSLSHCNSGAGTCGAPSVNLIQKAPVQAQGPHATASLTGGADLNVQAASVVITAASLDMAAGHEAAAYAQATVLDSGDKATVTGNADLDIKATGNIAITVNTNSVRISDGFGAAHAARVDAAHSFATASVEADAATQLQAGGALTVNANRLGLFGTISDAASAEALAAGSGATAKLTLKGGVSLTGATLSLIANSDMSIEGGRNEKTAVTALDGGSATTTIDHGVTLGATGAVTLTALHGNIVIAGGIRNSVQSATVDASGGSAGTAKATLDIYDGVSVAAGTNLTLKAGGSIDLFGGRGNFVDLNPSYGGSADVSLDASAKLSAGGNVSLTAMRSNIIVVGGLENGILVGVDTGVVHAGTGTSFIGMGKPHGFANGMLDAGATITAGQDVTLNAGGAVTVVAGAGETLAVGAFRRVFLQTTSSVVTGSSSKFYGNAWGGGSAHLDMNLDAAITAGRDIKVSAGKAGSGDIKVQGLDGLDGFPLTSDALVNLVSARGGGSSAVADLTLTADASLTAGRDIVLNAKGDASVDGGDIVVDADHTRGSTSINASAGATLHAGRNVVLNDITGSLTVAGINVNSSDVGQVSAAAHPDSTDRATVTAHADAAITAVGNISTVSSLGGDLNVVGGQFVGARASGSGIGLATATATANANITAGGSVGIKIKGDFKLLGGDFDGAVAAANSASGGAHTATMQARASITAGGQVSLSIGGNATVAGGDSMGVNASASSVANGRLTAAADVSAAIQGAGISLNVAKNLLVRAGSSNHAQAVANSSSGANNHNNQLTATGTADASLIATGNIAISVGKGKVGSASFIAGNDVGVTVFVLGQNNTAVANDNADMDITAGGNLSVSVGGPLHISGGQGAGLGASVIAGASASSVTQGGRATGNVSAKAVISVGGNLTVTLHGGGASLLGGGQAASDARLSAFGTNGNFAVATLQVDNSLTIKADGALKLTGASHVTVATELLASSAGFPSTSVSFGAAGGAVKSSVNIRGKSVNLDNGGVNVTLDSVGLSSSVAPSFDGTITITNTGGGAPIDSVPSPLSVRTSALRSDLGAVRSFSEWQAVPVSGAGASRIQSLDSGAMQLAAPAVQPLDLLQTQGLTVSLVTVLGTPVAKSDTQSVTLFTPGDIGILQPAAFLGSCNSLSLPQAAQAYRCAPGGK